VILEEVFVYINCRINGKYCGRCCYETEMILLPNDIHRISDLGFDTSFFVDCSSGYPRLRNVDGHCVFLNPVDNSCTIYPYRPLGCRLYPIVYDLDKDTVAVDEDCPQNIHVDKKMLHKYIGLFKSIIPIYLNASKTCR